MKHSLRIWAGTALVFAIAAALALYGPGSIQRFAWALNNNYSTKAEGDQLTAAEWNFLDEDFVKKEGDTMTGALNMGGRAITNLPATPAGNNDAASKNYVDSVVMTGAGSMVDTAGNGLRMVCGRTTPGATAWNIENSWTVYVDIPTNTYGFTVTPYYLTSLGGTSRIPFTSGATSVYTTANGFRVYVKYLDSTITPATANSYLWHINWCAVGR